MVKHRCPCCNYKTLTYNDPLCYEICPVCYWENDPVQNNNENYCGGANGISLIEAKKNYQIIGAVSGDMLKYVRKPFDDER